MMTKTKTHYSLAELTHGLDVTINGDPNCLISGISTIQQAQPGQITFLTNSLYRKHLKTTHASAVILTEENANLCSVNRVVSKNPHYTYARIAQFFADEDNNSEASIHSSAVFLEPMELDPSISIGPNCVIGKKVKLGANVRIGPNCSLGDYVEIGEGTQLDAGVSIYHHVIVGKRCRIASGVVLGSDGFGFANEQGKWHKVPQLGKVVIGDDVDIGANTTIDRGAIGDTYIANGVKLDNQIQVGHNVQIGENTIVAGCVGIAGSTTIGKNCMIGGAVNITGHISICDQVVLTGAAVVSKSIQQPGMYSSGVTVLQPYDDYLKSNARFQRLENLIQRVRKLEGIIKESIER